MVASLTVESARVYANIIVVLLNKRDWMNNGQNEHKFGSELLSFFTRSFIYLSTFHFQHRKVSTNQTICESPCKSYL